MAIFEKHTTTSDRELVLMIKLGDPRSFEHLFMRYYPRFRAFTFRFVRDESATDDIMQNVFLKLWVNRDSLKEDLPVSTFIFVLTKNEIYTWLRYRRAHITSPLDEHMPFSTGPAASPDRIYDYTELELNLQAAIEELPARRREIFRLNRYELKSAKEIAAQLGISARTVEKQIELALRHIRERLRYSMHIIIVSFHILCNSIF